MPTDDTPLNTATKLRDKLQRQGQPFLMLSKPSAAAAAAAVAAKQAAEVDRPKKKKRTKRPPLKLKGSKSTPAHTS